MGIDYTPVIRGDEALETLTEIAGKHTDDNVLKWRSICCVNPDIGGNNGSGECPECPIGKPPTDEDYSWCHEWFTASQKLRLKTRLENIERYVGKFSK